jgi:periplasmic divalent cation tolerance protein
MSTSDFCIVLCSAPSADAETIATTLVSSGLAACVSRLPVRSHYLWQGVLVADSEELLIIKTVWARFESIVQTLQKIHTYELPEIIALPLIGGEPAYLEWVRERTNPNIQGEREE